MPGYNQIKYIRDNKGKIKEPILIVGSKEYEFDTYNFFLELNDLGYTDITGIDIQGGNGVDIIMDICESNNQVFNKFAGFFQTVICMQVLYSVKNPFIASQNIEKLISDNGILIFSDVFSHKIHRIPSDYWRFTYDAHKVLFPNLQFMDSQSRIGITRHNKLIELAYPFPELHKYKQQTDESLMGYYFRKINRKLFFNSLLNLPRLLPELSIFSFAVKNKI